MVCTLCRQENLKSYIKFISFLNFKFNAQNYISHLTCVNFRSTNHQYIYFFVCQRSQWNIPQNIFLKMLNYSFKYTKFSCIHQVLILTLNLVNLYTAHAQCALEKFMVKFSYISYNFWNYILLIWEGILILANWFMWK